MYNHKAGIRACFDNTEGSEERDYNLVYSNNGTGETNCGWPDNLIMSSTNKQFGGCGAHWDFGGGHPVVLNGPHDIIANPLFKVAPNDYRLQRVSEGDDDNSPGINAGDDGDDMGAYGGTYYIDDSEIP